jgi:hypothetical protein
MIQLSLVVKNETQRAHSFCAIPSGDTSLVWHLQAILRNNFSLLLHIVTATREV